MKDSDRESPTNTGNELQVDEFTIEVEDLDGVSSRSRKWKWILFGSAAFVFAFLMSIFFASIYVHKKETALGLKPKAKKIVLKPLVESQEKKRIIKRVDLSPFFLRLKNAKAGEDRFLSAKVYIEFVSHNLPKEIETKKELLRVLVYRQLKKHFTGKDATPAIENQFKKELVPALNIFFKGGGVYDVGFDELMIR